MVLPMARPTAARARVLGTLAALACACTQANPDFRPAIAEGEELGGDTETDATEDTDTSTGTDTGSGESTDSSTSAGEESSSTDEGQPDTESDTEPDTETGDEYCSIELTPGLSPVLFNPTLLGSPCPMEPIEVVMRVEDTEGGLLLGEICLDCFNCIENQLHPVGAWGYDLATALPVVDDPNDPYANCYVVQVESLDTPNEDTCNYDTISIWREGGNYEPPVFVAHRGSYGLNEEAAAALDYWAPKDLVSTGHCACDEVEPGEPCCPDTGKDSYQFNVGQPGIDQLVQVQSTAELGIAGWPYEFYGAQAQSGIQCSEEVSWALLRLE